MIGALIGAMRLVDTWRDNRDKLEAPGVFALALADDHTRTT